MTHRCPDGHPSRTADYCDQCGAPIVADPRPAPPDPASPAPADVPDESTAPTVVERCPGCRTVRLPGDRYCEHCGHDFDPPAAEPTLGAGGWVIRIDADCEHWAHVAPDGVPFPADHRSHTQILDGPEVLIGRRNPDQGTEPDIDLAALVGDPAVSRRHALLVRGESGAYRIVDLGSANGTWLNDDAEPLAPDTPTELRAGDRIHLGAWTTITVSRAAASTAGG